MSLVLLDLEDKMKLKKTKQFPAIVGKKNYRYDPRWLPKSVFTTHLEVSLCPPLANI